MACSALSTYMGVYGSPPYYTPAKFEIGDEVRYMNRSYKVKAINRSPKLGYSYDLVTDDVRMIPCMYVSQDMLEYPLFEKPLEFLG